MKRTFIAEVNFSERANSLLEKYVNNFQTTGPNEIFLLHSYNYYFIFIL